MTVYSRWILIKFQFFWQIFEKSADIEFHENSSIGSRVVPCDQTVGHTDIKNLTVAFRNFSKAPKDAYSGEVAIRFIQLSIVTSADCF